MQKLSFRDLKTWRIDFPTLQKILSTMPVYLESDWKYLDNNTTPHHGRIIFYIPSQGIENIISPRIMRFESPDMVFWETTHVGTIEAGDLDIIEKRLDRASGDRIQVRRCVYTRWVETQALVMRTTKGFERLAKSFLPSNRPILIDMKKHGVLQWEDEYWEDDFTMQVWTFRAGKPLNIIITEEGMVLIGETDDELTKMSDIELAQIAGDIIERVGER